MHISLKSGENLCYFNLKGKCTNPKITKDEGLTRDWDSTQNCTYTALGVVLCGGYIVEDTLI